jgi:hypothetical protein
VRVLALLHRVPAVVGGVDDLACQLLHHRLLAAGLGVLDEPAHRQGHPPVLPDLDWHLVGGAADPAALHLHDRLHVVERLLEDLERVVLELVLHLGEGAVENPLAGRLLPPPHQAVDELGDQAVLELGIGQDPALLDLAAAGHGRT